MAEIELLFKGRCEVDSGKKKGIPARLKDYIAPSKGAKKVPRLTFIVSKGEGTIDPNGVYFAPIIRNDVEEEITISCDDSSVSPITVPVYVNKIEPIFPKNTVILSGGKIQYEIKPGLKIRSRWEIDNFARGKGNIDPNSGMYEAPEVIMSSQIIKIRSIDLNTGEKDETELTLLPIELRASTQPQIRAGENKVQLNIESHNDLLGLDNFSCTIKSDPQVGSVEDGGMYNPPKTVKKIETIEIEAKSKTDQTKKVKISFEVRFPLCPKCKAKETDANGNCPDCGQVLSGVVRGQRCPRCHNIWNGIRCQVCNYPKQKKSIF